MIGGDFREFGIGSRAGQNRRLDEQSQRFIRRFIHCLLLFRRERGRAWSCCWPGVASNRVALQIIETTTEVEGSDHRTNHISLTVVVPRSMPLNQSSQVFLFELINVQRAAISIQIV